MAALVRWPGQVVAGSTIDEPLWSPYLFVAASKLAEAELPAGVTLDGKNPLSVLQGTARSPHRSLFFEYGKHAALRQGDWKIVRTRPNEPWQLYNLADDLGEQQNLAATHPEQCDQLATEFERWIAEATE